MSDMHWLHRAACRDEDGELFFAVGSSGPALLQIAEAKTVCRRCPVTAQCLAMALDMGLDDGVFGGLSEDERRALKRRNARTRARANAATEKPLEADKQPEPGVAMAAQSSMSSSFHANRHRPVHVIGANGRSACATARVSMEHAVPAADVPAEQQCMRKQCARQFAAAAGRATDYRVSVPAPGEPAIAVAGESMLHQASSRWHPIDERGLPACGAVVLWPMQQLAAQVERERRCQRPSCRRAWVQLDEQATQVAAADDSASSDEPEPEVPIDPAALAPVFATAGDDTARWHALDEFGIPACGNPRGIVVRELARRVDPGRRCRRLRCARSWARLDLELAVAHG